MKELIDPASDISSGQLTKLIDLLDEFRDVIILYQGVYTPGYPPPPPLRKVNQDIDLEEGSVPPSRPLYRLSRPELDELQRQISTLLERGFIEPSKSPYGEPVFFVKKNVCFLRLVFDWRQLNKITVYTEACLPNMDVLFDTVQYESISSSSTCIRDITKFGSEKKTSEDGNQQTSRSLSL